MPVSRDAEGTLYVAFYNDGKAAIGSDTVEITGNYPVGDKVTVKVMRKAAGKVRFRIPAWSAKDADRSTWRTVEVPAGESVHELAFDLNPRLWAPKRQPAIYEKPDASGEQEWRLRMWMSYGSDKDIVKLARTTPGAEILRGPLLLAKAEAAGTSPEDLRAEKSIYGTTPALKLVPKAAQGTWAAWDLEIGADGQRIPVCDFMSAGDEYKDGGCRFSVWF